MKLRRGKFDTKVPILTHDEIGELATAFNQMGRQLQFNLNALSQEKELLASILSGMADGVITFNRDGTILMTNPPAELFLQNWYFEKKNQANTIDAVPSKVMELFELAVSTEKEQIGEITLQGHYWVMIVSPLYSHKIIRGAVAVVRDMTEERQLDKMRSDFIANVSHELRTPIAMMQGYSEAIVDDIAQTDEEKKEMATIIYDESLRMGRLVNELLDLARMESGYFNLSDEEVELKSFFQRIMRKFQGLSKEKNVEVSFHSKSNVEFFVFDSDRIEQVLTNLIDNAIRHTPNGGVVMITNQMDERGLYLAVEDTGSGIPEDDLPFAHHFFGDHDEPVAAAHVQDLVAQDGVLRGAIERRTLAGSSTTGRRQPKVTGLEISPEMRSEASMPQDGARIERARAAPVMTQPPEGLDCSNAFSGVALKQECPHMTGYHVAGCEAENVVPTELRFILVWFLQLFCAYDAGGRQRLGVWGLLRPGTTALRRNPGCKNGAELGLKVAGACGKLGG